MFPWREEHLDDKKAEEHLKAEISWLNDSHRAKQTMQFHLHKAEMLCKDECHKVEMAKKADCHKVEKLKQIACHKAEIIWMETRQNADNKRKDEKHQKEILALKLKEAICEAENERLKEDNRRQEDQHKKQIDSYKDQLDKMFDHMEAGNKTENKSCVNQDDYVYMS